MLLKQYHAIADERGCCLRDMDFLVKKFQLLVPKNHIIALSWELYLSSDISSNCSKGTLVSRLSFSLEFEKRQRKKRELNLTRHFAKPFFLVTLDTWCYLGVPSLGWFLRTNAKLRFFFCFGLSTSHFMALGICIDFSFNSGEYSIALKLKVLVFKHATSTNNHTNFLWKIVQCKHQWTLQKHLIEFIWSYNKIGRIGPITL